MVPDGGEWCDDIRWYCVDITGCTQRWMTSRSVLSAGDDEEPRGTAPDILRERARQLIQHQPG